MRGRVSDPFQPLRAAHNLNAPGFAGGWLLRWVAGSLRRREGQHGMNQIRGVATLVVLAALAACNKETPVSAPTAIVVPASSAPIPFPGAPASDPSLPSASVVTSQTDPPPPAIVGASSALAASAAASGASQP